MELPFFETGDEICELHGYDDLTVKFDDLTV
jgi:hypothetical protein